MARSLNRVSSPVRQLGLAGLALTLLASVAPSAGAQGRSAVYDRIVSTLEVQADGRVKVQEDQVVDFRGGPFSEGFAELSLRGASDIQVTGVGEIEPGVTYQPGRESPYTYDVERSAEQVLVRWWFPPTRDTKRHFVLTYVIEGALRFYEDGDQLWWAVIRPDQPDTREAVVTVALPATVSAIELARGYRLPRGGELPMEAVDPLTARLKATDVKSGESIEVRVQWPHGLVRGTPSPFQARLDRERAGEQALIDARLSPGRVLMNLLLGVMALLILIGGAFGLYLLWHSRGRDLPVKLPVDYLAEPPSDLAPGLVGTLLDESADLRDVLATLVDLCRRGELRMVEEMEEGFLGLGGRRDFVLHHTPTGASLAAFEQAIVDAVLRGQSTRRMSELRNTFYERLPGLQARLYEAVVDAGLFVENPEAVRGRYRALGCGGGALTLVAVMGALALGAWMPVLWALAVVLGLLAVGTFVVSQFMPRKSAAGAEAAARWAAFRNYLSNIERYRDLGEAREIFDRYLPYAVALGLDQEWIRRFAAAGVEGPPWFEPAPGGDSPWPRGPFGRGPVGPQRGPATGGGQAGQGVPDLQQTSAGLGRSLQGMSASLAAMLNTASAVMMSQPSSSGSSSGWGGGGWSGGGFSGGGGGGGGGGGFR